MRLFRLLIFPTILILLFQVVSGLLYIHHSCTTSINFTTNDPFETNLNKLMIYLSSSVANIFGFNFRSYGRSPYLVYGHALCRRDISRSKCQHCMTEASNSLRTHCPNKRGAAIWYDNCLIKYSDIEFYGRIDHARPIIVPFELSEDDSKIPLTETSKLLSQLANEASENTKRFAVGKLKLKGSSHLFGLAQCTPDLVSSLCEECLNVFIDQYLPEFFKEKMGAHFVSGSCIMTYDTHPFFDDVK